MGKTKRHQPMTIETNPRDLTKNQGHEYGKGRASLPHKHKAKKRDRQKLKNQLREFY